jgi:hypothetical protein
MQPTTDCTARTAVMSSTVAMPVVPAELIDDLLPLLTRDTATDAARDAALEPALDVPAPPVMLWGKVRVGI